MISATSKKKHLPVRVDPATSLKLKKAVEAIFVRSLRGKITFVMHKAYNVLLARAAEKGNNLDTYSVRLSDLGRDIELESKNMEFLKESLRRLNTVQVEWNVVRQGKDEWGVSTMLAGAKIVSGLLEYSFSPQIKGQLLDPKVYARIDLRLQTKFRSRHALALYEQCYRYKDNPSRLPWTTWRGLICDEEVAQYRDFKYFNRDVLKRALSEIEAVAEDIAVEPIIFREGGRVTDMQFRVTPKRQPLLALDEPNIFSTHLIDKMVALGVGQEDARRYLTDFEEHAIEAALDLVKKRINSKTLARVESPAAYFKRTLENDYAKATPKGLSETGKNSQHSELQRTREMIVSEYRISLAKEAAKLFAELSETKKTELLNEFEIEVLSENKVLVSQYKKHGITSPMVSSVLFGWIATKTWGEPRLEDALNFAMQSGLLQRGPAVSGKP